MVHFMRRLACKMAYVCEVNGEAASHVRLYKCPKSFVGMRSYAGKRLGKAGSKR